jgi:hypothetical protein
MSNKNTNKGPVATSGLSDKDLMGLLDKLIAQGAQELSLDRLLWKAESCGKFPVIGFIVSINDMPQADRADNPDWKAFIFRTTYETRGVDRGGNVVPIKAGSEVVVPANYELATNLARFALDPNEMHELGIEVKGRDDIGGGKKMWRFRVIATGNKEVRSTAYRLAGEAAALQLGEGGYDPKTGEVREKVGVSATV